MAKLSIFAAVILAAAGVSCEGEAWAGDIVPTGASVATEASTPEACTSLPADLARHHGLRHD